MLTQFPYRLIDAVPDAFRIPPVSIVSIPISAELLIVGLLTFLFARPFFKEPDEETLAKMDALLLIDASGSMNGEALGVSNFTLARDAAIKALQELPNDSKATVAVFSDEVQEVENIKEDELRPGGRETWQVKVEGTTAEAGAAELLAYMYDRSLDVFAPHNPPSTRDLLPSWTQVGRIRSNLGQAGPAWARDHDFVQIPQVPSLTGDWVREYSGYGIGGLGRRAAVR